MTTTTTGAASTPSTDGPGPAGAVGYRWTVITGGIWAVVRLVLVVGGARFSADYLDYGWQIVPVDSLRADPFGSVWFLHIQPPLYNLALGVGLRWSPLPDALGLQMAMAACSLVLVVCLQRLLLRLRLGPAAAAVVALVVSCDPELVRYEFGATYELPVATMVVLALLLAARYVEGPSAARLVGLSAVLTAIVLTRSLLHPLWLVGFLAVVLFATQGRWRLRQVVAAAALPLVFVGGWVVKNEVVFGHATLSSWFGMNLARAVIAPLPRADLDALMAAGTLSPVAGVAPFTELGAYEGMLEPCLPSHDHPAVAEPSRPNGVANFNAECFLPVYDAAGADAWAVVRARPGTYLSGRAWALASTMARSSYAPGLRVGVFEALESVYHVAFVDIGARLGMHDWSFPLSPAGYVPVDLSVVLAALLAVQVGLFGWSAAQVLRRSGGVREVVVLLASGTALFVVTVGSLFELGENMRFRSMVNPLYVAVPLAMAVEAIGRAWRSRRAAGGNR